MPYHGTWTTIYREKNFVAWKTSFQLDEFVVATLHKWTSLHFPFSKTVKCTRVRHEYMDPVSISRCPQCGIRVCVLCRTRERWNDDPKQFFLNKTIHYRETLFAFKKANWNPVIKYMEYAKLLSLCVRCVFARTYTSISIKGVQNALKCIKQIEIYYHLNANANVNGVRCTLNATFTNIYYYTVVRILPSVWFMQTQIQVVGMKKNLHPFIFHGVCLLHFCLFVVLAIVRMRTPYVCNPIFSYIFVRANTVFFRNQLASIPFLLILYTEKYTHFINTA